MTDDKFNAYRVLRTDDTILCREDFPSGPFAVFKVAPSAEPLPALGMLDPHTVLTPVQAAATLGTSVQVLSLMRQRNIGPVYHRPAGGRSIWYVVGDLLSWRAASPPR